MNYSLAYKPVYKQNAQVTNCPCERLIILSNTRYLIRMERFDRYWAIFIRNYEASSVSVPFTSTCFFIIDIALKPHLCHFQP